MREELDTVRPELIPATAGKQWRYWIGLGYQVMRETQHLTTSSRARARVGVAAAQCSRPAVRGKPTVHERHRRTRTPACPGPTAPADEAASTAHPGVATEEETVLKYFISTHRTQGQRANDFNSIPDLELVDLASKSHDDPDHPICGCARSFVGFDSRQATTTAEIVESDMTTTEYVGRFHAMLLALGFQDTPKLRADAANDATELLRIAAQWPVGTVVERRGDEIRVRRFPDEA
jgi:hypothetical protein